ncbi:MAG: tetratricopeptide repeat protein [Chlamydiales bacterium]|nr:tetratricopeptide repeat protein [Chlamydiales bacterium]
MAKIDWKQVLGWKTTQLEDLRFVGYNYAKDGKYNIALSIFEALVVLNSQSIYDLQTLGAIYLQVGNNINALNCFEKALKFDPEHLPTIINRIKAMYLLGYKDIATQEAKKLVSHQNIQVANVATALINCYT